MLRTYHYTAISSHGETIQGSVEAESLEDVLGILFERELTPIHINEKKRSWFPRKNILSSKDQEDTGIKLKQQHILEFTQSCANLMKSGFSIDKAIHTIGQTASSSRQNPIQELCQNLFQAIEKGLSLSQALSQSSPQFSSLYISLITAGEESGQLAFVFQKLALFLEEQQEFKKTIRGIMLYPIIVMTVSILSIIVMLGFVIPRFIDIFNDLGQELPLLTHIMISLSQLFRSQIGLIIVLVITIGVSIRILLSRKSIQTKLHRFILKAPLFGDLVQKIMIARFASTLSMLLEGGLKLVPALKFAQMTVSNLYISNAIHQIREDVTRGEYVHKSMQDNPEAFPPLLIHMLAVGEETGNVEGSLNHISQTYENEVRNALKTFTTILSPLLILIMGLGIALIIAAMLLPILQVTDIDF